MTDPADPVARFNARDHKRHDGLDGTDRFSSIGLSIGILRMPPDQEVRFGPRRDEWITIARKPE
jgi:hypothetical protein